MSDLNKDQPDVKGKEKVTATLDVGPTPKLRGKRAAGLKAAKPEEKPEVISQEEPPALPSQDEIQVLRAAVEEAVAAQSHPPKNKRAKSVQPRSSSPKPQPAFLLSEHPELLASDDGTGEMLMYAGLGLTAAGVACLLLSGKLI